jgi:hypothetical protein
MSGVIESVFGSSKKSDSEKAYEQRLEDERIAAEKEKARLAKKQKDELAAFRKGQRGPRALLSKSPVGFRLTDDQQTKDTLG